jgi:hypothetical protein
LRYISDKFTIVQKILIIGDANYVSIADDLRTRHATKFPFEVAKEFVGIGAVIRGSARARGAARLCLSVSTDS